MGIRLQALVSCLVCTAIAVPALSSFGAELSRVYDMVFREDFGYLADSLPTVAGERAVDSPIGPPDDPERWSFWDPPDDHLRVLSDPSGIRITGEPASVHQRVGLRLSAPLGPTAAFEVVVVVEGEFLPSGFEAAIETDVDCRRVFWVGSHEEIALLQWCSSCEPEDCPVVAINERRRQSQDERHTLRLRFRPDSTSVRADENGRYIGFYKVGSLSTATEWRVLVAFNLEPRSGTVDCRIVEILAGWDIPAER